MKRPIIFNVFGLCLLLVLVFASLLLGSANIPFNEVIASISGKGSPEHNFIVTELRVPRTLTAMLGGMALAVSGLLMQTVFSNPLAGPFILGISSGASLTVALATIGLAGTTLAWGIPVAAMVGSLGAAFLILLSSRFIKHALILLIVGVMISAFASALVTVIQYWSDAASLKRFVIWSMGDFASLSLSSLPKFVVPCIVLMLLSFGLVKPLNGMLMGSEHLTSVGLNPRTSRLLILSMSALLAGLVTAYCGPVAFIGLAVPNVVRFIIKTADHRVMLPSAIVVGGITGVLCDIATRMPGSDITLPLNAVSALIGAPIVVLVLMKSNYLRQ